ncbi:MAG TPA: precorrin-3B C(17)-methyltransferase [Geminicoccaceae bacterium]|nr:precorrin-3B C(17)-methyltransferase [Geminicoccaceae bacterium]
MSARPAIVVLGPSGLDVARRIRSALPGCELHGPRPGVPAGVVPYDDVAPLIRDLFRDGRPIIALCAAGILIRVLAPLLGDKRAEPPVVAVADDGSCAVPLLGGHRGANRLAREIAQALGGHAAITTAGDVRFDLALDAPPPGWRVRNPAAAKAVMGALLADREVALRCEAGDTDWLVAGGARFAPDGALEVLVTDRDVAGSERRLVLHPPVLALGVGCERGIAPEELSGLVETTLAEQRLTTAAIACVVSLELKADEPAIHALAGQLDVPARFFPAATLEAEVHRLANPSELVFRETGCHGVAEGAALAAVGPQGELLVAKTRSARATLAIGRAQRPLDPNRIGSPQGSLAVVGLGPGAAAWRTPEVDALLADAEDWVGYRGYLELLGPPPGGAPVRHGFALGEETARVEKALELAGSGRRVALISSGDAGIYGMASLACELLAHGDDPAWRRVALTFSPGVSALQAAAARAGAPLGHDFCAISLSDLLTPWSAIERRLEAAAGADFVTVLFNPASRRRREGLARALAILGAARGPATPVIHARNLGREGEGLEIASLSAFDPSAVDMLSLLIIGSRRTRWLRRPNGRSLVYTPRGYAVARAAPPRAVLT